MMDADLTRPLPSISEMGWEAFRRETVAINRAAQQGDWGLMQALVQQRSRRHRELLSGPTEAGDLIHHQQILGLENQSMDLIAAARNRVEQELVKLRNGHKAASAYEGLSRSTPSPG